MQFANTLRHIMFDPLWPVFNYLVHGTIYFTRNGHICYFHYNQQVHN